MIRRYCKSAWHEISSYYKNLKWNALRQLEAQKSDNGVEDKSLFLMERKLRTKKIGIGTWCQISSKEEKADAESYDHHNRINSPQDTTYHNPSSLRNSSNTCQFSVPELVDVFVSPRAEKTYWSSGNKNCESNKAEDWDIDQPIMIDPVKDEILGLELFHDRSFPNRLEKSTLRQPQRLQPPQRCSYDFPLSPIKEVTEEDLHASEESYWNSILSTIKSIRHSVEINSNLTFCCESRRLENDPAEFSLCSPRLQKIPL